MQLNVHTTNHGLRAVQESDGSVTAERRPPGDFSMVTQRREIRVPGVATFRVSDGTRIRVVRVRGADPGEVEATLHGRATAALLQQRLTLPMHLAGVVVGGRVVGLAGPPGIGKSSLACALAERGHALVTDDLAALTWQDDGRAAVPPGPTTMRIWGSTARALGWATDDAHRAAQGIDKYAYDLPGRFARGPRRLGAIYVLMRHGGTDLPVEPLTGFAKFEALYAGATYNREFLDTPPARSWHFGEVRRLAQQVPTFALGVPAGDLPLRDLASLVERHAVTRRR